MKEKTTLTFDTPLKDGDKADNLRHQAARAIQLIMIPLTTGTLDTADPAAVEARTDEIFNALIADRTTEELSYLVSDLQTLSKLSNILSLLAAVGLSAKKSLEAKGEKVPSGKELREAFDRREL